MSQRFSDISTRFISNAYELLHKIGEGGFGVVYKAIYKRTGQTVAIKFLHITHEKDTNQQARQSARFERESNIVSQLSHAHIVRLLDKGVMDDSTVFSVFEFVEGTSLSDHLKQNGALSINETYDVMLQVLDAIVYAHSQGIIHRDVKPSNIMLNHSGAKLHVKLLDFGISTLTLGQQPEDYRAITITQESLGTPTYCSPEQLRGELTTFSTDLYMWGLVFIECLTGAPAIPGTSVAEIYHQHLNDVPIKIPAPLLDHPLGALLERTLRKNPKDRIDDGQILFDDLNSLLVNNLVGKLLPDTSNATHLNSLENNGANNTATLLLRSDDPNFIPSVTTQSIERRYMTVLSLTIDVRHTDRYDAAESDVVEALFQSTQNQYIDVARRYGGFHVGNLSNQSVFYFGYPVGSDHDARLAARTALEVLSLSKRQASYLTKKHGCTFETNCGIHSGIMLKRSNQVPEGFTSHTATQMAQAATNRQILCSADTQAILAPYYNFSENRYSEKINAVHHGVELTSERVIEAFGFIRGTRNAYPLVGRQTELCQIRASIKRSEQYNPEDEVPQNANHINQAVYIHADAGIGKSRLIQELRRHESTRSQKIFQCLPEHQNNALYPVLTVVKHYLNRQKLEGSSEYRYLIDTLIDAEFTGSKEEITTLLAIWLNLPDIDNKNLSSLSPAAQKELLFEGLAYLLRENTTLHPLYIFEDVHWADNTTLEFIAALLSTAQNVEQYSEQTAAQIEEALGSDSLKLASEYKDKSKAQHKNESRAENSDHPSIVITSRNELPAQLNHSNIHTIALAPLDQAATEAFISELFEGADISDAVKNVLLDRTDGVPLFIEELATAMRRNNTVRIQNNTVDFTDPDNIDQIPSSLRESIQSKIDHLVYAKDTLQLASSFGRQFNYNLLVAASPYSELQVQNDLDELINNQVIIQQRHVDGDRYLFKHALVRDAGYDSIDTQTKPAIHGLIANAIQEHADVSDRFIAAELAYHYEQSIQYENAAIWYKKSADLAEISWAFEDAISLYENAIGLEKLNINNRDFSRLKSCLDSLGTCLGILGYEGESRKKHCELYLLLNIDTEGEWKANTSIIIGRNYGTFHNYKQALKQFFTALDILKSIRKSSPDINSSWQKIWLRAKREIFYIYFWQENTNEMKKILNEIDPIIDQITDKSEKAEFFHAKFQYIQRKKLYDISLEDLNIQRQAVDNAKASETRELYTYTLLAYGMGQIHCKLGIEAIQSLKDALSNARQKNERILEARCLTYLALAYRIEYDEKNAFITANQALQISQKLNLVEYVAIAHANIAWVHFYKENIQEAKKELAICFIQQSKSSSNYNHPLIWISHILAIALNLEDKKTIQTLSKKINQNRSYKLNPIMEDIIYEFSEFNITESNIEQFLTSSKTEKYI
ncbi:protein kinase domain-containing protein [Marinomonas balearica]|uniref:AAA ATPase-like protein n=1 Tax=Marinomonas balearica TaxID=491947 RepID=A0A4R6MDX0_9GAMM|nr:protein kinase [Marinomonas balearica]TDO99948.1 AAA ATPase-like protein [Marinomonas balearica]